MGKTRLIWIGGTVIILILLAVFGGRMLGKKYCWDCTAKERYARGVGLLCAKPADDRELGLKQVLRAAAQGVPEALSLAGEIYLGPLPKRYLPTHREVLACLKDRPEADRQEAADYFAALAATGELSAKMKYNLGVLLDAGILTEAGGRTADDYYQDAARHGEPRAMFELGLKADRRKDYAEAAKWYKEAFSRGQYPGAALALGDYDLFGRLGKVRVEQAAIWYQKVLNVVKSPTFAGNGEAFTVQARSRLAMVESYRQRTGGNEALVVPYRLSGGFNEYRVRTADTDAPIGRVIQEGEVIKAFVPVSETPEGAVEEEREVASMNEGLDWLLETYAAGKYGGDKKFRFVLITD